MKQNLKIAHEKFAEGHYRSAVEHIRLAQADPREDMDTAYLLSLCALRLEDYRDALAYLQLVIDKDGDRERVNHCRVLESMAQIRLGRHAEAVERLRALTREGCDWDIVYAMLGYAYNEIGEIEKSVYALRKALDLVRNMGAVNSLGYILADREIDIEEGLRLCREAVDSKPDYPPYLDSLGWALYKNGEIGDAQACFKTALRYDPDNAAIQSHLREAGAHA